MNRLRLLLCIAVFMLATPSLAQSDSVIRDGKEWLQPANFVDPSYHYDLFKANCPGGACSGTIGHYDLTGLIWASLDEINALFNSYGVFPEFTGPNQERQKQYTAAQAFFNDFEGTGANYDGPDSGPLLSAWLRPSANENDMWVTSTYSGIFRNTEAVFDILYGGDVGMWFWRPLFKISLEEPVNGEVHSGIGNLRGWAITEEGIDRVEIYIDGKYIYDAPFGGERTDVGDHYPDIAGSNNSGFSLAFGYSNLGVGQHTITARAFNSLGESMDSTATFEVVAFHKNFIPKWDIVDTSQASMTATGDEILLDNVSVDGQLYELRLKWRTAEQGFEIIEIR